MSKKDRVVVAMSGGVDSSVSAGLLLQSGCEVTGVFMHLGCMTSRYDTGLTDNADEKVFHVREAASHLGIELEVLDLQKDLEHIIDYFVDEYRRGRTPNPCVMCNRQLKFGKLMDYAVEQGADYFATGHYAQVRTVLDNNDKKHLCRGIDKTKDQSYALFDIARDRLDRIIFPLGEYTKTQVVELARQMNLPAVEQGESQEICFVPDDDYARLVMAKAPELSRSGKVVNTNGDILGEHQGVFHYTIGQRRGLGIALGEPAYVVRLDADSDTVILGNRDELLQHRLWADGVNWLIEQIPTEPFTVIIQIRYNHRGAAGTVTPLADENGRVNRVMVDFAEPVSAITPGQAAVFYNESDCVLLGGGWITNVAQVSSL
ncbi:MAG: tRNA 2-thiouridine(34) synthase MnmA [Sedimentisphaerales bacterium]|nr:tRNA 2-thiouridine(34) synthase MnmA [Sedimentisphaerales bacterium]